MATVDRILDAIASAFKVLATACLAIMVALNMFNVVWRALFDQAFGWIFNWTMLLFAWMLLIGLFVYTRDRRDVIVDVFAKRLPNVPRRGLAIFGDVVGIVVMVSILKAGPQLFRMQQGSMDAIDLPIWMRSAPLYLSALLVLVHFLNHLLGVLTGRIEAFPDHRPDVEGAVE